MTKKEEIAQAQQDLDDILRATIYSDNEVIYPLNLKDNIVSIKQLLQEYEATL